MNSYSMLCLSVLAYASLCWGQTFSAFLSRVNSAPMDQRGAIVDSFMQAVPGFPYIEETNQAHFLYRGAATSVSVPGDMNGWTPGLNSMTLVNGTDLWYFSRVFEADARLDYKFVLNNSNWILDPRNPYQVQGGFGPNSELRMPEFVPPPAIEFYPDIPHGALRDTMFASSELGNTRRVRIYTPPNYDPNGECYALLVVHDGLDYLTLGRTDRILDYLIHENAIQPVIAVFVPAVNREPEYAGNQQAAFGRFITQELLPFVDAAYNTCDDPQRRATAGASNGGNISLWLAVTYPEVFGLVCAQSPNVQSSISDGLEANANLGLRFYVDIGTYDILVLIPLAQNLVQILEEQDYPYYFQTHHDGHSWGNWRAHLDEGLTYLLPAAIPVAPAGPPSINTFELAQNYPNPFNPTTNISFTLLHESLVDLQVYDTTGRVVASLVNSTLSVGKHEFEFDGTGFASGIYFARVVAASQVGVVKMVLLK
ncbi:MAG: T9SS type A sorting domain-containing protein [bacterium]|nr:T9SS type A sorting domain-containing protein [bacterium]